MASIGFLIGGALVNALAFTGSNYLFSSISKESIDKERKRHDKAIEDLQRAQIELEPLPSKPVLSDFYVPSEDHHNRELAFIILSMIGIGALLWYSDK